MRANKNLIIAMVCTAVMVMGSCAWGYYYFENDSLPVNQTDISANESTKEPETETETETTTEEASTEEITTPEETEPQTEAVCNISEGVLPKSADDFIIAENVDDFFQNSVFIGDSVMMGFRNYVMGQEPGFLSSPEFLVSGSFSVRMALTDISSTTIHPIYQGEQRYIWDSISMMGAKKAFLFFGLNDIGMEGVDGAYTNYIKVIEKIKEQVPETELYVISTTNMLASSERKSLNNENIRLLNQKMEEYCYGADVGYIDIASFLVDETGGLKEEFCSDNYVHQTQSAYEIWIKVLRGYASGGNFIIPEEPESSEGTENPETEDGIGSTQAEEKESEAEETSSNS